MKRNVRSAVPRLPGFATSARNRDFSARSNGSPAPRFAAKSILVPIDFSECSKNALGYATALAKQFDGNLTVLHVVKPYLPVPEATMLDVGLIERGMRKAAEDEMARLQREFARDRPFRALIRAGNPAIEVVKAAKSLGSDLIIISTHGRTGIGHWLLGSTAEKVVRHAACPVLVVRQQKKKSPAPRPRSNGAVTNKC